MQLRVRLAAAAAGVLAAAGMSAISVPAVAAPGGCSVQYKVVSEWQGGFQGDVAITGLGGPLTGWTLEFDFPAAGQGVSNGWNADWSQSGAHVTAKSLSWNGNVPANGSVSIGFIGKWSGSNPVPAAFTVNGVTCNGASPSPSPSSSPSPSPSPSPKPSPSPSASPSPSSSPSPQPDGPAPQLHVSGNRLVTSAGKPYRLLGVNRSSGEFACIQGRGMWDGPADQASVAAMKPWNIHVVRIPLNEECWLGTGDVPSGGTSGAAYQQAVKDYVNLLIANGITPIVEMHWNYGQYAGPGAGCSDVAATCQKPMPDAKYAPTFWTQVANTFKGNNAVIFDLFNEPYPDAANNWTDATAAWTCLRDGGTCAGIGYQVAGMQTLVDAVRATGAANVIMTAGLTWTNDLSQWLNYKPKDPTGNLMASWHSYNFNGCVDTTCWNNTIGAVAAKVPVVAGEIGQNTCAHDYIDKVMNWADANGVGYLAWTWNAWGGCDSSGNVLITDANGTPTSTFGEGFKAHLVTQNPYA
ncbi:cellulase family glycosylhydrolase [Microbispora sp. GKU 823]|uniref:cellulase family glycosylhydrolase n=1 Tax=Microbispora sp. GKU 823 TaxID=1652100 RepID=UPI0009D44E0D|nr:cellulase family glycosylhydrolase [Microbispora sp. GKU 823]OPG12877.1 cellulose-binding protein [Microbispora sp. GKU 823]